MILSAVRSLLFLAALFASSSLFALEVSLQETGPLKAGDIRLEIEASPDVKRLIVFYGENNGWLVRMATEGDNGFQVTLYGYTAPSLTLRFYAEDEKGQGKYLPGPTLPVEGGKPSETKISNGITAGFNVIPSPEPEDLLSTGRIFADLAQLGLNTILLNLYTPHFEVLLDNGRLDSLLTLADKLGLNIWLTTRDTEALGGNYLLIGGFTPAEVERHAFEFVFPRHYTVPTEGEAIIRDDTGGISDQWSLPTNSAKDILFIKAWRYDYNALDPLPTAVEIPAESIEWEIDFPDVQRKFAPRLKYVIRGLDDWRGKAVVLQIGIRTLRLWTIPPVWDDQYYAEIYKKRIVEPLVRKGRLKEHPSVVGVATINEPTFTWEGGDLFHPSITARWQEYLKKRFGSPEEAGKVLGRKVTSFEEIPYLPRLVYSGSDHTSWSGYPGEPGFTSEYELCKNEFKEELMNLVFERTIGAYRELMPDKEYLVKFQHAGPSTYALHSQQADLALRGKDVQAMAYDFYPFGYWPEGEPRTAAESAPYYLGAAGYGGLLGQAYGKPTWAAETNFGRARTHADTTAATTELTLDLLFASGFSRVFLWAIPPPTWSKDDPYWAGGDRLEDRTTKALERQAEFMARNKDRNILLPRYDVVVLTPKTDAVLFGANKDHYVTSNVHELTQELVRAGLTVGDGPLTPETLRMGDTVVLPGGIYLSDTEKELILSVGKPLLILGAPYPFNPVDGNKPASIERKRLGEISRQRASGWADAPITPDGEAVVLAPPKSAMILEEIEDQGKKVATIFQVANRITCTSKRSPADAAKLVKWWFEGTRK